MKIFPMLLKNKDIKRAILLASIILFISSCKTNIENFPSFCNKKSSDICFYYKNKNVMLNFTPHYIAGYHKKYIPISFEMTLPKGIKRFLRINEDFLIQYIKKQIVVVKQHPLQEDVDIHDTIIIPSQQIIENYVDGLDSEIQGVLNNEKLVIINSKRNSLIIRKCRIEVLLVNIKPSHFNTFIKLINQVKFLPFQGNLKDFNINEIINIGKTCE